METPSQPANFELGDCSQLYHHTVPIFDCDRNPALLRGTGVFIAIDKHRFVVSAAHVFEPSFENIGLGFRDGSHFGFLQVQGGILIAKDQAGGGDPQRTAYKDDLDFSIIEPEPAVIGRIESRYHAFDLRGSSYSPQISWAVVSGWPAKKNAFNRRTRQWKFHTCYHIQCPFVDKQKVRRVGWNEDIFFGLSADKEKDFASAVSGERIHLPKLAGVSGSGMWVRPTQDTWSLAGIVVEDDEPKRMLKVLKIRHLWSPLSQYWGLQP